MIKPRSTSLDTKIGASLLGVVGGNGAVNLSHETSQLRFLIIDPLSFRWCICGHRTIQKSNLKAHMKSCKKLSAHRATTLVANLENDEPTASPSNEAVYNTHPGVVEENLHIAIRPLHDSNINIPSPHAPQVHVARPGDGDLSGHSLIIHRPNVEQDHTVYNPFGFTSTPLGQTLPRDSGSGPHYQPRYEEFSLVHRYSTLPLPIPDEGGRHRTTNDFPLLGYVPAYHGEYQYQFSW